MDGSDEAVRRRVVLQALGAGALGAAGASVSTGTAAAQAGTLTWMLQDEVYDLFPADPSCSDNVLVHRTEQFQDGSGITETDTYGSPLETTYEDDAVTIENTSGSVGETWLLPWAGIPNDVPSYALYASIDTFDGGEAIVGVYDDVDNHVEVRLSHVDGTVQVFEYLGGSISNETDLTTGVPSAPVDVLVTFMGDALAVNYRTDGGTWQYAGWTELGTDSFYDREYISEFAPGVGALCQEADAVSFSECYVLSTQQFGYRDPFLVTHKDGAPLIEDDRYVYMTWSAGAPALQYGAQNVLEVDLETHEVALVGRIVYETRDGQVYPDYPTKIIWDDDAGEFLVLVSGWVTFTGGPDEYCHTYVTRTTANVLEGLNVLSVDDANLPGTGSAHVYDIDLRYESDLGRWRGCANETPHAINTIETADDSLTGGWSVLAHLDSSAVGGGVIEGGRVRTIDGAVRTFWANSNAAQTMSVSTFPDITTGIVDVTTDADNWTSCLPSHPQVIEIPDETNDATSYLMLTFGTRTYEDMGCLYSEGDLLIFEAQETTAGLEYPPHPFPSDVGASGRRRCGGDNAALEDGSYRIDAVHSGKPIEAADDTEGATVQQNAWSDADTQKWLIEQQRDGTYRVENVASGSVLDVAGASIDDGANVIVWSDTGGDNQRFAITEDANGVAIEPVHSTSVLEVAEGSTADAANVQQWTDHGDDHQRFTLELIGTDDGPPPIGENADPPTDPDGDGRFEDISGDGTLNFPDVNRLFQHSDTAVVRDNVQYFDFEDDGEITIQDVMALFRMV